MGVKKIKVLLGFKLSKAKDDEEAEKRIGVTLKVLGYEPQFVRRSTKKEVKAYLKDNADCCHAVLMECIGGGVWSQNELAELVDDREIRLVVVLTPRRAGEPEYLSTLYAAGITCAVFEQGRKGASAEEAAGLLVRPRSRRQARAYYRIEAEGIAVRSLTNEAFNGLCVRMTDPQLGPSYVSRLLALADDLNPYQMGDFLRKIPEGMRSDMERYAEYGQLVSQLRESGVRVPYRRPWRFRTMNDDVPFLEGAKGVLEGHGAEAFLEEGTRAKLGRRKKEKTKTKEGGETKVSLAGGIAPPKEAVREVMEGLRFSNDEDDLEDAAGDGFASGSLAGGMSRGVTDAPEAFGKGGGEDEDAFFYP